MEKEKVRVDLRPSKVKLFRELSEIYDKAV